MFQTFTPDQHFPTLQRGQNGIKSKAAPHSIAGESTTATESDVTGGVNIGALSISDVQKQTSYNQSDRLKRYVETNGRAPADGSVFGGSSASMRPPRTATETDDDSRSVSTAFASQVGPE